MKNILISGYYGSKNGGDEAMLAAILETLRGLDGELKFTVISMDPEYTKKRHNVEAVAWLNIWAIVRKILSADLLISGGGSLLQNVTSRRSLYYYLGVIMLAKLFGRKVMLYAQGIGPICGNLAKWLMNLIVNQVDLITVRDKGSLAELGRLQITKPKIFCTADPVLAIKPVNLDIGRKILAKLAIDSSNVKIGISVRRWKGWENCNLNLAKALDRLFETYRAEVVFIPMQFPEDIKAAKQTAELMTTKATVIEEELSTQEILSLVGCVDVLISIRLHALIFAGVMGVPMLGISYDPKIDRFLDSIGEKPLGTLASVTAQEIYQAVAEKLSQDKICKAHLKGLNDLALLNAKLAIELLKGCE